MVEMKFQGELRPAVKEGVFGYRRWKERGRGGTFEVAGSGDSTVGESKLYLSYHSCAITVWTHPALDLRPGERPR